MNSENFYFKWSAIELPIAAKSGFLSILFTNRKLDERVSKIQARSDLETRNLVENLLVNGKEYFLSTNRVLKPRVLRHKYNLVYAPAPSFFGSHERRILLAPDWSLAVVPVSDPNDSFLNRCLELIENRVLSAVNCCNRTSIQCELRIGQCAKFSSLSLFVDG
jgi:hypothetical protein